MSAPPSSYEHPGSPPARPELPEGIERPPLEPAVADAPPPPEETPAWPLWAPFAALLLALFGAIIGATFIALGVRLAGVDFAEGSEPPGVRIGGSFVQDFALIASALVIARYTARPAAWQFGLRRVPWRKALGQLVVVWVGFYAFSAVWAAALGIRENSGLPDELGTDRSDLALAVVTVFACVVAPIAEEFFFRGFCYGALRRTLGVWGGAALTGAIFGAIHAGGTDSEFLVPLAVFGFGLCLLYQWSGSLLPCFVLHSLNNCLAVGVSQGWSWEIPLLMIGSVAAVLALTLPFTRARRRTDPAVAT